ncbi:MAG: hypothetical protein GVY04_09205 [Cyanobacteria bacterium]|jgi:hypothetical protein|nr:hypothetical protein [Cyanobacteria bacterium GSL.Bin1]
MSNSLPAIFSEIEYPKRDNRPLAESDLARKYLIYGVEALSIYFQDRQDVYVSGNLLIYYTSCTNHFHESLNDFEKMKFGDFIVIFEIT